MRIYTKDMPEKEKIGFHGPEFLSQMLHYGSNEDSKSHLEARQQRTERAIGEILAILRGKNLITDQEMFDVVGLGDWEVKQLEATVKVE